MLTCPTCSTPLVITPPRPGFGRATCLHCGVRYPVVIHRQVDGSLSAAFKAKRTPLADIKERVGLRMYRRQVARCRAAGKTPQQVLDEAVEQLPPLE